MIPMDPDPAPVTTGRRRIDRLAESRCPMPSSARRVCADPTGLGMPRVGAVPLASASACHLVCGVA
jgi:hypothetical protein